MEVTMVTVKKGGITTLLQLTLKLSEVTAHVEKFSDYIM